jgi:hypothetical protein
MASVANVNLQFLADAACGERITTTTGDHRFLILRMDAVFHDTTPQNPPEGGSQQFMLSVGLHNPIPRELRTINDPLRTNKV